MWGMSGTCRQGLRIGTETGTTDSMTGGGKASGMGAGTANMCITHGTMMEVAAAMTGTGTGAGMHQAVTGLAGVSGRGHGHHAAAHHPAATTAAAAPLACDSTHGRGRGRERERERERKREREIEREAGREAGREVYAAARPT